MRSTLRDYQHHTLAEIVRHYREGKRRIMVMAPTGSGKTVIGSAIVEGCMKKGNRVAFVVPTIGLIEQTIQKFQAEGIHAIGVMQAKHWMTDGEQPVQVCSMATLSRRDLPDVDVVIIDEAHRMYQFANDWMLDPDWADKLFIGLSATPWSKGLGIYYETLIIGETTAGLIERGDLSPFKVFAPSHPDLKGVRTVAGDYHEGDLSKAMNVKRLTADIIDTWKAKAENRPTLVYCVDRAHARSVQQSFILEGIPAEYIDANTDMGEREAIGKRFNDGRVRVVVSIETLTTGIDWDVRCIVMARPTKSEMLFCQIVGRGLRTADGKDYCLILDHSDNHIRLGFVTDINHEYLDDGREKSKSTAERKEPLPTACPACGALKAPKQRECAYCHFIPTKQNNILIDAEAELVEMQPRAKGKASLLDKPPHLLYGELTCYAFMKNYNPKWAVAKYKDITGRWPKVKHSVQYPPSKELLDWLRRDTQHWIIARRKGHEKELVQVVENYRRQHNATSDR
jgi:superfamily II DNA or RNA helicase